MRSIAAAFLLSLVWIGAAAAAEAPGISVEQAWARATAGSPPIGAVYFILRNTGGTEDVLTGAETGIADKTEMHQSMMNGTMMSMSSLGAVLVPAGGQVEFKPGGKHLMLFGLKSPLLAGQSFTLTLKFKNAGARDVKVDVRGLGMMGSMQP